MKIYTCNKFFRFQKEYQKTTVAKMTRAGLLKLFYFIFPLVIFLASCSPNEKNGQKHGTSIISKIMFPEINQLTCINSNDSLRERFFSDFSTQIYKIVVYADSLDCFECDLKLIEWKQYIREIEKRNINATIFFILNYKYYNSTKNIIKRDKFTYPIFFDIKKAFLEQNKILKNKKSATFLLDENNTIILTGNPINNEKMWNKYIEKMK